MASSVDGGTAPRQLANRINLDAQLDEQRQREYEALVRWCTSNRLTWSVLYIHVLWVITTGERVCVAIGIRVHTENGSH